MANDRYISAKEKEEMLRHLDELTNKLELLASTGKIARDNQYDIMCKNLEAMRELVNDNEKIIERLTRLEKGQEALPRHGIFRASNNVSYHINAYYTPNKSDEDNDAKPLFCDFLRSFCYAARDLMYIAEKEGPLEIEKKTGPITSEKTQEEALKVFKSLIKDSEFGCMDERFGGAVKFIQGITTIGSYAIPQANLSEHLRDGIAETETDSVTILVKLIENSINIVGWPIRCVKGYKLNYPASEVSVADTLKPFTAADVAYYAELLDCVVVSDDESTNTGKTYWPEALKHLVGAKANTAPCNNPFTGQSIKFDTEDDAKLALHAISCYFNSNEDLAAIHRDAINMARVRGDRAKHAFKITDDQYQQLQQIGVFTKPVKDETKKVNAALTELRAYSLHLGTDWFRLRKKDASVNLSASSKKNAVDKAINALEKGQKTIEQIASDLEAAKIHYRSTTGEEGSSLTTDGFGVLAKLKKLK